MHTMKTGTPRLILIAVAIGFILGFALGSIMGHVEAGRYYGRIINGYRNEMANLAFPARAEPPCIQKEDLIEALDAEMEMRLPHTTYLKTFTINDLCVRAKGD